LHGARVFDVVTSRAVAPLPRLARWSLPLVRRGGWLIAMKGASAEAELARARPVLTKLGAGTVEIQRVGVGLVDPPTTVIRVEATRAARVG
ncbi:MAG: RsmG family class I SAM-dependent methyltransferase, partial [Nocardioides sp.]